MTNSERIIYWLRMMNDAFNVEVPELPGCMADGKTIRKEALQKHEAL